MQFDRFQGDQADAAAYACVKHLVRMGHLPPGYGPRDPACLPRLVANPVMALVGREAELGKICMGLRERKRVLVVGGPGEGKTALLRTAALQVYDEGTLPAGVFEIDLTGWWAEWCRCLQCMHGGLCGLDESAQEPMRLPGSLMPLPFRHSMCTPTTEPCHTHVFASVCELAHAFAGMTTGARKSSSAPAS